MSNVCVSDDVAENGAFYNNGIGWTPIDSDSRTPFAGVLDGSGHTISRLSINIGTTTITGSKNTVWVGDICGYLSSGAVEDFFVSGTVSAYETRMILSRYLANWEGYEETC